MVTYFGIVLKLGTNGPVADPPSVCCGTFVRSAGMEVLNPVVPTLDKVCIVCYDDRVRRKSCGSLLLCERGPVVPVVHFDPRRRFGGDVVVGVGSKNVDLNRIVIE